MQEASFMKEVRKLVDMGSSSPDVHTVIANKLGPVSDLWICRFERDAMFSDVFTSGQKVRQGIVLAINNHISPSVWSPDKPIYAFVPRELFFSELWRCITRMVAWWRVYWNQSKM